MECEKSLIYVSDGPGFDAYVFAGWLVYSPFGAISMRKAGDFDPSSRMVGCACIKDLLIISHGMANGVHETGENVMVDWQK